MFSINRKHKKQYIAPVIEFEMMEEEVRVMAVSGTNEDGNEIEKPSTDPNDPNAGFGKRSDFIFDDGFDAAPASDGELSW